MGEGRLGGLKVLGRSGNGVIRRLNDIRSFEKVSTSHFFAVRNQCLCKLFVVPHA